MPQALERGIVTPQKARVVEGKTMLERSTHALDLLREGVSSEKLIWRVNEDQV